MNVQILENNMNQCSIDITIKSSLLNAKIRGVVPTFALSSYLTF